MLINIVIENSQRGFLNILCPGDGKNCIDNLVVQRNGCHELMPSNFLTLQSREGIGGE